MIYTFTKFASGPSISLSTPGLGFCSHCAVPAVGGYPLGVAALRRPRVSAPTIPKVRGSNPSGGTLGIRVSRPVRVWILCFTLAEK